MVYACQAARKGSSEVVHWEGILCEEKLNQMGEELKIPITTITTAPNIGKEMSQYSRIWSKYKIEIAVDITEKTNQEIEELLVEHMMKKIQMVLAYRMNNGAINEEMDLEYKTPPERVPNRPILNERQRRKFGRKADAYVEKL